MTGSRNFAGRSAAAQGHRHDQRRRHPRGHQGTGADPCRGLVGAMITVYPAEERSYDRPEYEPSWLLPPGSRHAPEPAHCHPTARRQACPSRTTVAPGRPPRQCRSLGACVLGHLIFTGVFERYPRLHVGTVEHELSWVPHFLERLDYTYTQRARRDWWYRFRTTCCRAIASTAASFSAFRKTSWASETAPSSASIT